MVLIRWWSLLQRGDWSVMIDKKMMWIEVAVVVVHCTRWKTKMMIHR